MNVEKMRIVIVGLGKSGVAAAHFLHARGADLTLTDSADAATLAPVTGPLAEKGIRLELGIHRPETFLNADLIVLSPGVAHTLEPIARAAAKGIPVWGEIELASRFIAEPIIAVTGTNGKTTTTRLIGEMLTRSGLATFVGGNIGTPLIQYAGDCVRVDRVVAEISSFQLDTIHTFRPQVGVLLNVTADHLDRYADMQAYADSKARIFENQTTDDVAVLNIADPWIAAMAPAIRSQRCHFNVDAHAPGNAVITRKSIVITDLHKDQTYTIDLGRTKLLGRHNHENIAAAALAALSAGADLDAIHATLDHFKGLPHRLEWVACHKGVDYYDDSKATNVDAVARAVENFDNPLILIMGGRDKGGEYSPLAALLQKRAKLLIVIGEAAEIIRSSLGKRIECRWASSMGEAVSLANQAAVAGDAVLLSPACSSFDMFNSYAHRGEVFRKAVAQLGDPT